MALVKVKSHQKKKYLDRDAWEIYLSTVAKSLYFATCHLCMTHMCRHHIATCVSAASHPLIPHEKQGCAGLRLNSQYKQFFLPPPPPPRAAPPSAASSVHLFQKRSGTHARARSHLRAISTALAHRRRYSLKSRSSLSSCSAFWTSRCVRWP